MTTKTLTQQIEERAVANAIVFLDPGRIRRTPPRKKAAKKKAARPARGGGGRSVRSGRISREVPQVDDAVLSELSRTFNEGWTDVSKEKREAALARSDAWTPSAKRLLSGEAPEQSGSHMLYFPYLGIVYGALNQQVLESLANHDAVSDISHAAELSLIHPQGDGAVVGTPPADLTWGLNRMRAPEIWQRGFSGSDILIAHLDTGADSQHPALHEAVAHNMVFGPGGQAVGSQSPFTDTGNHGTQTAGILVGRNDTGGPVIGMAPGAALACGTVIEGGDTIARVLAGMDWALQTNADILSMSLGFRGYDDSFEAIMKILREQDLLPVIAIGNEGPNTSRSPGNYETALSVGASDENDEVWGPSGSEQNKPATGPRLCAPGMDVLSAIPGNAYKTDSGTSMAAPHVAGLAALLFEAKPNATIDEVQKAIIASCENPAAVDSTRIGAGIPNGLAALDILLNTQ